MPVLGNARHEAFAQALAKGKSAAEAYVEAGYKANRGNASVLKQDQNITNRIAELLERRDAIDQAATERAVERLAITKERVLEELAKIAFADIRKAVRWGKSPMDATSENASPNGLGIYPVELVPSEAIDDDTAGAVSEVSLTQTGIKIKMHDKKSALVDLGKHLGMFVDRKEITGANGGPIEHKVSDDADRFTRAIAGLAARTGTSEGN